MTIIVREVNGQTVVSNDVGTAISDALLPQVAAAQTAQGLSEAARDLSQQYASDAAGVSGVNVPSYASRASLAGATVAAAIKQIATRGYATEGDGGGANYVRTSFATITSAGYPARSYQRSADRYMPDLSEDATNGGYFVNAEPVIKAAQFGWTDPADPDAAAILADLRTFAGITGRPIDITDLPAGGTVTLTSNPFAAAVAGPVKMTFGEMTLTMNFQTLGSFRLDHGDHYHAAARTRVVPSSPMSTWPNPFNFGFGLFSTAEYNGTASGTSGSDELTVADGSVFRVGSVIGINGILDFPDISETISTALTDTTTGTISFSPAAANTIANGGAYLKHNDEIIYVLVNSGGATGTLTTRGALGTTAVAHDANSVWTLMAGSQHEVTGISGNVLTLDPVLPRTFTSAPWFAGAVDARLSGDFEIDGGWNGVSAITRLWNGVKSALSRRFRMDGDITVRNCPQAGVFTHSSWDYRVDINEAIKCGNKAANLGVALWHFGQCRNGSMRAKRTVTGYLATLADGKSSNVNVAGTILDPTGCSTWIGHSSDFTLPGELCGIGNSFVVDVDESASGPLIDSNGSQYTVEQIPSGNFIQIGRAVNFATYALQPRVINAAGNTVIINGQRGRLLELDAVIASTFTLVPTAVSAQTFTFTGALFTDRFFVSPPSAMANGVTVQALPSGTTDGQVRLRFGNAGSVSRDVVAGEVYRVRAEAPWNP